MTEAESSEALKNLLVGLGVQSGETIYLGLDMGRLPLPHWPVQLSREAIRAREDRWCSFLFDNIMEVLGPKGTLLLGTFSYSCSNSAIPFVLEETPSEIGPFTNWLRRQPEAMRSLHPIFSVSGIGARSKEILTSTGAAAFGPCSPFGRLAVHNARFVNLGIPFRQSLTYVHHLEQCYGCNHRYHKVLPSAVFMNGQQVPRKFLGYMRWRGVDATVDVGPLEDALKQAGVLREVNQSGLFGQSVLAADIDRIGYAMLAEDSCAFSSRKVQVDLEDEEVASHPSQSLITVFRLSVI